MSLLRGSVWTFFLSLKWVPFFFFFPNNNFVKWFFHIPMAKYTFCMSQVIAINNDPRRGNVEETTEDNLTLKHNGVANSPVPNFTHSHQVTLVVIYLANNARICSSC